MWRRTPTPDGVRLELDGVELADAASVGPVEPSPAATPPPTDAELIRTLQRQIHEQNQGIAHQNQVIADLRTQLGHATIPAGPRPDVTPDVDAALDALRRAFSERDKLISSNAASMRDLHAENRDLGKRLQEALDLIGNAAAVAADRDRLDAANGRLVERVRELEKQLAAARPMPPMPDGGA